MDEGEADAGRIGVGEDDRAKRRIKVFDDGGGGEQGVEFVVVFGGPNPEYICAEQDVDCGAWCWPPPGRAGTSLADWPGPGMNKVL